MSVLLYVHQKREAVWALPLPVTGQGSTPCSLISLSILYVLLRTLFVMSHPSYLAWKGEEHRIQKNPDLYYSLCTCLCVCIQLSRKCFCLFHCSCFKYVIFFFLSYSFLLLAKCLEFLKKEK